ncbi:hypothetical protein IAI51_19065 [Pseudomonas sp. N40(2020)]|uniref:hypothetical protein n=1 Tax=Pseudomonas sp. N40(2020) TaxID=2767798 RepID=UPI0016572CB5|nr:hypothetical protein [Pseudomonas sp. N40(2020)]MBC8998635.1 hypothetical protein [Pseudomonas sp. N40(2020)]
MHTHLVSAMIGAIASSFFTSSDLGFLSLCLLSGVWGGVLSRFVSGHMEWTRGVVAYCFSVLLFSSNVKELYGMSEKGLYQAIWGELPEMLMMVVLLPLLAVITVHLFRIVNSD